MSLKEEIFDIIVQQDAIKIRYVELEKIKQTKLKQLEEKSDGN